MIADQILVAASAIDLGRKSMCISSDLAATSAGHDDRESREDLAGRAGLQPARGREVTPVSEGLECSVCPMT